MSHWIDRAPTTLVRKDTLQKAGCNSEKGLHMILPGSVASFRIQPRMQVFLWAKQAAPDNTEWSLTWTLELKQMGLVASCCRAEMDESENHLLVDFRTMLARWPHILFFKAIRVKSLGKRPSERSPSPLQVQSQPSGGGPGTVDGHEL